MKIVKADTPLFNCINVRRLEDGMTVAPEPIGALLVRYEKQEVGTFFHFECRLFSHWGDFVRVQHQLDKNWTFPRGNRFYRGF